MIDLFPAGTFIGIVCLSLPAIIISIIYIKAFHFPHSKILTQSSSQQPFLGSTGPFYLWSLLPFKILDSKTSEVGFILPHPVEAGASREKEFWRHQKRLHCRSGSSLSLPWQGTHCSTYTGSAFLTYCFSLWRPPTASKPTCFTKECEAGQRQGMTQLSSWHLSPLTWWDKIYWCWRM